MCFIPYVEQGKFDESAGSACHPISLNSSQNTCDEPLEISFDESESTTYCRELPFCIDSLYDFYL